MKELIYRIAAKHRLSGIDIYPPASKEGIKYLENKINMKLPEEWVLFYSICNGFTCTEDIFNMKTIEWITEYPDDFGNGWFHFCDYMINSDMWTMRKNSNNLFEIINKGEEEIILTTSLNAFLERFLEGGVFDPGGLYAWHEQIKTK